MAENYAIQFGIPDEWVEFAEDHKLFLERFPNLKEAMNVAFVRQGATSEPVDRVVFFSGRLCTEDFMEILLLCGNGYGIGALKIVRGMYERCVTARYLHAHTEETEGFFDFYWLSQFKLAQAIKDTFGEDVLPKDKVEELKSNRDRVRTRFMVRVCEKCGATGENFTWTKLDFVSMAREAGSIGQLIVPGYYLPIRQAHSTVAALLSRLIDTKDGGLTFDEGPQREQADDALITAHNILLNILDLQKEHFTLNSLEEPLQRCFQDFIDIWRREPGQ
jgi:Family of unknown function (DUF5677)